MQSGQHFDRVTSLAIVVAVVNENFSFSAPNSFTDQELYSSRSSGPLSQQTSEKSESWPAENSARIFAGGARIGQSSSKQMLFENYRSSQIFAIENDIFRTSLTV